MPVESMRESAHEHTDSRSSDRPISLSNGTNTGKHAGSKKEAPGQKGRGSSHRAILVKEQKEQLYVHGGIEQES